MVKRRKNSTRKGRIGKGFCKNRTKARKINASTVYETCTEQLSPFGGLLALIKFFDLVNFHKIFDSAYQPTSREPKLGHYAMMVGILMLLFIGFNRIWHFVYIRLDAVLCGFFRVTRLPAASTFWRYVDALGINQAKSLLNVMSILRERVWQLCDFQFYQIRINSRLRFVGRKSPESCPLRPPASSKFKVLRSNRHPAAPKSVGTR